VEFGLCTRFSVFEPPRDPRFGNAARFPHFLRSGLRVQDALGHLRSQKANHYLDATAYAMAARTIWGLWTIRPKQGPAKPARKPPSRDRDTPSGSSWIQTR
jgi:hypothetical protein